jgi:signal transduction histidine kinase
VTGLGITLYSLIGYHEANGYLGTFVAFYTVAAHEPRRTASISAAVTAACILVSYASYAANDPGTGWTASLTAAYLSYGLAWLIGDNLRVRRAYTRQLENRAAELVVEREEKAALAVSEERARIARELHDVVAHHVSVMVVQSAGARRVLDSDPALARQALEAVEAAGRTALAEMRRMLEVLRTDDSGVGPQPSLAELDRLIAQVREAGLPVELKLEGAERELPAGMDLAAYRIVQEALTNAVKHAGKARAVVSVKFTPESLEIEVVDDGRGAAAPLLDGAGGHGLIGMHERVSLYGGKLENGPVFGGGYRVKAEFPLEPEPRGSLATCCDEESALSEVAAAAEADRARAERPPRRKAAPENLVKPRVVPPMIGRVVPPHRAPSTGREGSSRARSNEQ